ncbi:MAG: hypothetical protein VX672_00950 [Planctomycetota bacterium]|nr:hypothetical protein [Planctomycetota bacterium]
MSIPILGPLQMLYFKLKNRRRARIFGEWAKTHGLQFAPDSKGFEPPANPAPKYDMSGLGKHSAKAAGIFARLVGMSKIQSSYPQFASNRLRGEWQSDKNISWGTYRGRTVVVWDTVYYDLDLSSNKTDWQEGEYTSIMILTETPIHSTLITPNSLGRRLSAFGIEEGRGTFSMHTVNFELDAFNKAYRVKSKDAKWAFAIIDQAMMEWLMQQKKHTMELAPGGVTVSTWFTLTPEQVQEQLDFCLDFLDHFPEDLKRAADPRRDGRRGRP